MDIYLMQKITERLLVVVGNVESDMYSNKEVGKSFATK